MVDVELALEVVTLMLHDAGQKSGDLLFVGLEILVDPFQPDVLDTSDIF